MNHLTFLLQALEVNRALYRESMGIRAAALKLDMPRLVRLQDEVIAGSRGMIRTNIRRIREERAGGDA